MSSLLTFLIAISLAFMSGFRGWHRAKAEANLRSRPIYHGLNHGLWVALPMLAVSCIWLISDSLIIKPTVLSVLTQSSQGLLTDPDFRYLEITQIANGLLLEHSADVETMQAVASYLSTKQSTDSFILSMLLIVALLGFRKVSRRFNASTPAREQVERIVKIALAASSAVAVLTTAGIVLALLFETLRFFQHVPFTEFLFGTHWSPQMAIREDQ
ncbi:MAG: phosphate ABC transporter permease family protein, partial [Gammaproteobacteria bacterium]|nr:phosphate ABC transporter permease family protein [Gammaproteobacteria bacterium]